MMALNIKIQQSIQP